MAEIKENNDMSKAKIGSNKTQENATVKAQAKSGTKVTKNTFFQKALRRSWQRFFSLLLAQGLSISCLPARFQGSGHPKRRGCSIAEH
jgi:hypothetical protein